jgi:hypothetical protein
MLAVILVIVMGTERMIGSNANTIFLACSKLGHITWFTGCAKRALVLLALRLRWESPHWGTIPARDELSAEVISRLAKLKYGSGHKSREGSR